MEMKKKINEKKNKMETVGFRDIFIEIFGISINTIIFVIILINYLKLDDELKKNVITTWFLIIMVCLIIGIINLIIRTIILMNSYGTKIDKEDLDKMFRKNTLVSIINGGLCYGSSIYMTIKFVPFKNSNCHGYNIELCSIGRLYGFIGILCLICLSFVIITLITVVIIAMIHGKEISKEIREYVPETMLNIVYNSDNTCPICLDDSVSDKKMVETVCKHKYHELCLNKYMESIKNSREIPCPLCKKNIKCNNTEIILEQPKENILYDNNV